MRVTFIYYSGLKAKVVSPGEIVGSNKVYEISPQVVYHLPVRNPLFIYSFIYFIKVQTQVTRTVFIYLFFIYVINVHTQVARTVLLYFI